MSKVEEKILIMGIGNYLMEDDGFGVHFIKYLEEKELPSNVTLIDVGTSISDHLDLLCETDKLICVDVAEGGGSPGDIYKFTPADINYQNSKYHNAHKITIFDTLEIVRTLKGNIPECTILAVEPKDYNLEIGLSKEVEAALKKVYLLIKEMI